MALNKAKRIRNPEERRRAGANYYQKTKDSRRDIRNKATKEWFLRNPDYQKDWGRKNRDKIKAKSLKNKYNITLEVYNEMLVKQNYRCAICDKHRDDQIKNLSVDHCHATGAVRALLCDLCNRGLGFFKESEEFLERAFNYIKRHRCGSK